MITTGDGTALGRRAGGTWLPGLAVVLGLLPAMPIPALATDTSLVVGRFFGPCSESDTPIGQAHGEACISQAILDAFSAKENGVKVDMRPANWDRYYEQLRADYDAGTPPDVHILHRHRLTDFVESGLLAPLGDDLAALGVDLEDWHPDARDAVTLGDEAYGVPIDMHANLWHINLALMSKAGLIRDDGRPLLPESPGEMLDHARRLKEATGSDYLASDFVSFPIGVRAVLTFLWQQGQNVFDGDRVTIDTAEMRAAVTTMTDLFDAGYANPAYDYERAQRAFLEGEVAILVNGTWAVELYDREASKAEVPLTDYDVADFPTLFDQPATWADSHLWVIPAALESKSENSYQAALMLLRWINEHNLDWARTGHLAVRRSVLESRAYAELPHRLDYTKSSQFTEDIPRSRAYEAIQETLTRNLQAVWKKEKSLDEALAEAEAEVGFHINLP